MTDRLDEIQARLDATTPGEWVRINTGVGVVLPGATCQFVTRETTVRDATFIAAAPTDIAYLLERVRRLEEIAVKARGLVRTAHPTDVGQHEVVRQWWDSLIVALTEGESNE